ncbi:MAG TPA: RNA-directed DNA polymerase [Polyangiaceae bacterium]|nr:RNA-directed DNA polymerase [Polyangiaceae bacterium]
MARSERIGLDELYYAYRKAKHYAFRDPNTAQGFLYADYEQDLSSNLQKLHRRLNRTSPSIDSDLVGGWTAIPRWSDGESPKSHFYSSDPDLMWNNHRSQLQYRVVASAAVDMQVFNALWCMTSGTRLDSILDHTHVFASHPHRGGMVRFASGLRVSTSRPLFQYWPRQYAQWQRQGLHRMRTSLREGRAIVALTMDIQKFYHRLDAAFLASRAFLGSPGLPDLGFSETEGWLNHFLVDAIRAWNELSPQNRLGLPVGWTSSAVLANAALRSFDQRLLRELSPLYYGRYVDDVFLVAEPHRSFDDSGAVMKWLEEKLGLTRQVDQDGAVAWSFSLPGLERSQLAFGEAKQKIFCLQGEAGLDLIRPIEDAIRRRTSEFRALPVLPTDDDQLAANALLTTTDARIEADALRKAEAVSVRRHGFSLLLKKADEYRQHLDPKSWTDHRRAFFGVVRRHLLTARGVAELSGYMPRVFSLAASVGDWRELTRWIRELETIHEKMGDGISTERVLFERSWKNLWAQLAEAIVAGAESPRIAQLATMFRRLLRLAAQPQRGFADTWQQLRMSDWLIQPQLLRKDEKSPRRAKQWPRRLIPADLATLGIADWGWTHDAMMLATRVPTLPQLHRIDEDDDVERAFRALTTLKYGRTFPGLLRVRAHRKEGPRTIRIGARLPSGKARLIVVSLRTHLSEWSAAVHDRPVQTADRFTTLTRLLNWIGKDVVDSRGSVPPYALLPELAIPQRWAAFFAGKLAALGVSLIAGLEYRRSSRNRLINEVMLSFAVPRLPGEAIVLLQRKRRPAWDEGRAVRQAVGRPFELSARPFPVYVHGDLRLAAIICSDFTDARARVALQGAIDLLIVPEWNKDVDGFSTLVEGAALDIHAFIAQINNREYGDSRVRVAAEEAWKRDLVRLRGGDGDFYATADIDYLKLRRFQSNHEPPHSGFKPFPIGFKLDPKRRVT